MQKKLCFFKIKRKFKSFQFKSISQILRKFIDVLSTCGVLSFLIQALSDLIVIHRWNLIFCYDSQANINKQLLVTNIGEKVKTMNNASYFYIIKFNYFKTYHKNP